MTNEEKAVEFGRRQYAVGVNTRRIFERRSNNYYLSYNGTDLGSKCELLHRGKVVDTLYILPRLDENVKKSLKGY